MHQSAEPDLSSGARRYEVLARQYLSVADAWLPGRIAGFYVVGSAALGAFRPGRSDVDFVAVVDRPLSRDEIRRLRAVHAITGLGTAARGLARAPLAFPEARNGVYVAAEQLGRPVTAIVPEASHVGHLFHVGRGFDVNPVMWRVLEQSGIALRGPAPSGLALDAEPLALRAWNRANLETYWRPWADRAAAGRPWHLRARPRWAAAWGVLGAPRLHYTLATGDIVSKEAAGRHAREAFDDRWHALIDAALAYRERRRIPGPPPSLRRVGAFVQEVVAAARRL